MNFFQKLTKKIFILNIVTITVIACLVATGSSHLLSTKDLPRENFVNITMSHSISEKCPEDQEDENCMMESVISESHASGMIFKSDDTSSYILTADHFCHSKQFSKLALKNIEVDTWITDINDISHNAKIIFSDEKKDLCIIRSDMLSHSEITVSLLMPDIGEKIYMISAPLGIRDKNVSLHFEGSFSGCNDSNICFFTIPVAPGSSGSLVLDRKGRIVGMVQMATTNFETVSLGVGSNTIRSFLNEASSELKIDFR